MSSSSNGTSSFYNNKVEDEVVGSRPTRCVSNTQIKKESNMFVLLAGILLSLKFKESA